MNNLWRKRTVVSDLLGGVALAIVFPVLLLSGLWLSQGRSADAGVLLALGGLQTGLALWLLRRTLARRVLDPLQQMTDHAANLAAGRDEALAWHAGDETGRLAIQLEQVRRAIQRARGEHEAVLHALPVGVVFVRNRVIELVNRRAEQMFGFPHQRMIGRTTEVLYASHEQYEAVGDRAYSAIDAGGAYFGIVEMTRRDGSTFSAVLAGTALRQADSQDGSVWMILDRDQLPAEMQASRVTP